MRLRRDARNENAAPSSPQECIHAAEKTRVLTTSMNSSTSA